MTVRVNADAWANDHASIVKLAPPERMSFTMVKFVR